MSENQIEQTQGVPLSADELIELLDINNINRADLEDAAQWWDNHATGEWQGVLDSDPINDNT